MNTYLSLKKIRSFEFVDNKILPGPQKKAFNFDLLQ